MPCNTIQINKIQFNLDKLNEALLKAVLKEAGALNIYFQSDAQGHKTADFALDGSAFIIRDNTLYSQAANTGEVADRIKRLYSKAVVQGAAAANGWHVQQISEYEYNIIRN